MPLNTTSCHCTDKEILSDRKLLARMLKYLMIIRKFEEKINELHKRGFIHGTTHLGIGEEATGVGTGFALADNDYILATHRGHVQVLGKGGDPKSAIAEILGKESGMCRGRGGSMHFSDLDKGILCANGIVGANAPLACGAALSIISKGQKDRVSVAFFGDGASSQGAIHESMNLASIWNLPMIFCLVNNGYGLSTPIAKATRVTDLAKRSEIYGMRSFECDGNDVLQVYQTTKSARKHVLENGPALMVLHTYRTSGHSKSDTNVYRSQDEIDYWKRHNPTVRFSTFLVEQGIFANDDILKTDKETDGIIEDAAKYAINSQDPDICSVLDDVYA